MKHLGDITKIDGHKAPLVDIVTGGSPCQDLSVAGKRAGLAGERSGLFMEQIRIIKEMRDESERRADRYIRPRFMVWENVPGAFSSNNGEDFRAVLEETVRVVDPTAIIPRYEGGGLIAELFWDESGLSLGGYMTCSFGVAPKDVVVSRLSQILEDRPHPKYCLSAKACQGILNRAKKRGKELPKLLEETLVRQSRFKNGQDETGG